MESGSHFSYVLEYSRTPLSTINYPGLDNPLSTIREGRKRTLLSTNSRCGYFASARTKGNWKERGSERIKTLPALVSRRVSEGNLFSNSLQTYYVKHLCISCILELEERFCISLRPPSFAYKSPCLCLHEEVVQNILGGQTYSLTRKKCDFNVMLQWFLESGVSLGFNTQTFYQHLGFWNWKRGSVFL